MSLRGEQRRRARWVACASLMVVLGRGAGNAHACFNAYHARRIVLGSSLGRIVVLDLDWQRVDRETKLAWRGPVKVGLLAAEGGKLLEARELPAIDFSFDGWQGQRLEQTIAKQIRAGLVAAHAYPRFRPVGMPRHEACDFGATCGDVRIGTEPGHGAFLTITRGGSSVRVPLVLPDKYVDDLDGHPGSDELASSLSLVSLLSYDIDGREALVVDLGNGDDERGDGEMAMWPPCGCHDVTRCPPLATTMHHGTQFEVVVLLATPPPAPARPAASAPAPALTSDELSRAEGATPVPLRTDGIYAAAPVCDARKGWSRRFLRFFPEGVVRQLDGNDTPARAFRNTANGSHWVFPEGTYKRTGRRISATIVEDKHIDPPRPSWTLDAIVEKDGLRALSGAAKMSAAPTRFSFTPLAP